MTDETHHINESADKIVLKTKLTRGTGTRDQEKIDVKIKGNDPDDAVRKLDETLEAMRRVGIVDTVRNEQPLNDE